MGENRPVEDFDMTPAEAKITRSRLEAFAPDWDSPNMDAYDDYDAATNSLERGGTTIDL